MREQKSFYAIISKNENESGKNDEKAEQCSAFYMTAAMMDDISCISPFIVTVNGNVLM